MADFKEPFVCIAAIAKLKADGVWDYVLDAYLAGYEKCVTTSKDFTDRKYLTHWRTGDTLVKRSFPGIDNYQVTDFYSYVVTTFAKEKKDGN